MKPIKTWQQACKLKVYRGGRWPNRDGKMGDGSLEPGVNFFVLMLEKLGCKTFFSCEGHPCSFYVAFSAPYKTALKISQCGFFSVEVEGKNYWSIRLGPHINTEKDRKEVLTWAADAWTKNFGPITSYKLK